MDKKAGPTEPKNESAAVLPRARKELRGRNREARQ